MKIYFSCQILGQDSQYPSVNACSMTILNLVLLMLCYATLNILWENTSVENHSSRSLSARNLYQHFEKTTYKGSDIGTLKGTLLSKIGEKVITRATTTTVYKRQPSHINLISHDTQTIGWKIGLWLISHLLILHDYE